MVSRTRQNVAMGKVYYIRAETFSSASGSTFTFSQVIRTKMCPNKTYAKFFETVHKHFCETTKIITSIMLAVSFASVYSSLCLLHFLFYPFDLFFLGYCFFVVRRYYYYL